MPGRNKKVKLDKRKRNKRKSGPPPGFTKVPKKEINYLIPEGNIGEMTFSDMKKEVKKGRSESKNDYHINIEEAKKFPLLVLKEGIRPQNGGYAVALAENFLIVEVKDDGKIIKAVNGTSSYLTDLCRRMSRGNSYLPVRQVFLSRLDMPPMPREKFDAIVAFWHQVKKAVVVKAEAAEISEQEQKPKIAAV